MKRLTLGLMFVLLVSAGCAHVTTDSTEIVRISEDEPRTVRGETWAAPYCVQNARFDRIRVRSHTAGGRVAVATREAVVTDDFGTFSSTGCADTPPLPVGRAFYCGDFDPTVVGTDDASLSAVEMCLQPIEQPCSATRDLACRGATLLLSDFPEGWRITFEAATLEERILELVDRHLARVDAFEVVRATPLAGHAQLRAVTMMSGVAVRRLAPPFQDALARLRAEIDAETSDRRQILLERHRKAAQTIAVMLSDGRDETEAETGRRVPTSQADWVRLLGQESTRDSVADSAAMEPEVHAGETREPVVASSSASKPAVLGRGGDRPAYDEVDWSGEVERKLGESECPGPVLIRPASLAGDELRAVEVLARTISNLGRQTILSSVDQIDCTLLVRSPRKITDFWQWEIDVQGPLAHEVHLQVAVRPYLVSARGPTVWDPSTQTAVSGEEAYALLDPVEAATVRQKRRSQRVAIGVGLGTLLLGAAAIGLTGYLLCLY